MVRSIIFHHTDNDGFCSAALLVQSLRRKYRKEVTMGRLPLDTKIDDLIECVPINYSSFGIMDQIHSRCTSPRYKCQPDEIWIVDLSLTSDEDFKLLDEMLKTFKSHIVWIDHHSSSLDAIKHREFDVFSNFSYSVFEDKGSAAMLVYKYLHADEVNDPPMVVKWVSDYDTFTFEHDRTEHFYYGSMMYPEIKDPKSDLWTKILNMDSPIDELMCIGIRTKWAAQEFYQSIIKHGYEVNFTIVLPIRYSDCGFQHTDDSAHYFVPSNAAVAITLKAFVVNTCYKTGMVFREIRNFYDVVIAYCDEPGFAASYSIYQSMDNGLPGMCDLISGLIDDCGGGHPGAAGFRAAKGIFNGTTKNVVYVVPVEKIDKAKEFLENIKNRCDGCCHVIKIEAHENVYNDSI